MGKEIGGEFELQVMKSLNYFLEKNDIIGIAIKHHKVKYRPQLIDVTIEFRNDNLRNLGFECKSAGLNKTIQKLTSMMSLEQFNNEKNYLHKTNKNGFIIFKIKISERKSNIYIVSFKNSLGLRKMKITDENLNNTSFVKKLEQEDVYINNIKTKIIIFDKSDLLFYIN